MLGPVLAAFPGKAAYAHVLKGGRLYASEAWHKRAATVQIGAMCKAIR